MQESKFTSRKFIVTMTGMTLAGVLAAIGKMSGDMAGVIVVAIGAYNYSNSYISAKTIGANNDK